MFKRNFSVTALSLASALSLAACGGGAPSAAECQDPNIDQATTEACLEAAREATSEELGSEPSAPVAEAQPEVPTLEGPASEPGVYPGGITAEIVSVEAVPAESWVAEDQPGHDTMVRITVKLSSGPDDYPLINDPLGASGPDGNLLYGENRTAANAWAVEGQVVPELVTETSPVTLVEEFSLPSSGLDELVYRYTPDADFEEPWIFTDVQELL